MVKAWNEKVIIPTYEVGEAEKNPIFLEKRVYQGSSGVVYPYPVIEKIEDSKVDKSYDAVYLENEYIKVMILPELGGRVQMAYDKIKKRHFVYYNHVIKPALVGLAGPWISGGIEFNWPQHHRPSTFSPVDYKIEEFKDGSVSVWVSEVERMTYQKGMAGFTLRPGKAYLEIKGNVYNRTAVPQTFLWWANPAVAVNDYYQSVFPPDVRAVFDHGKRDVSTFPIATGTYYKVDYSAGVDISNYKNLPVPTSYMARDSKYDFVGGYENDTQAGVLHVANNHISPGKKQWTWGNGDFGRAWDRNLTDEDGPYIELMAGIYTDNQPDFTWLQPYEEKTFKQYFLPYRELGMVKSASKDLLMNLSPISDTKVRLQIFATSKQNVQISLSSDHNSYYDANESLSPEAVFDKEIEVASSFNDLKVLITSDDGVKLMDWQSEDEEVKPIPESAKAALNPEDIGTTEELYLTGLHIEQYRHATYSALDYYQEALKRDKKDARTNNALGLWYLRRGRFSLAEEYFTQAVKTLTQHNPNPYDGEPYYNLGLSLKYQGRYNEAYDAFYKSCWNGAWQDSGYFSCAQISLLQGRLFDASEEIDKSLVRNWHNHRGRHLKSIILRKLGEKNQALELIKESVKLDQFNFGCLFELYLLTDNSEHLAELISLMRDEANNYHELAIDYASAGCYQEAIKVLDLFIQTVKTTTPLTYYYKALYLSLNSQEELVKQALEKAAAHCSDYCFPNKLESILALQFAIHANRTDGKAFYYLGNLWYDKRQYDLAIACWEKSAALNDEFPIVWRNLSLAYFNKRNDVEKAVHCLEHAYALNEDDARVLMELDQLYKRLGYNHAKRLDLLNLHDEQVNRRDDLYLEKATLLNQLNRFAEAKEMIDSREFHPWEGGEGKVTAQYQISRLELAKQDLKEKRYNEAIVLLEECLVCPHNLGEGKLAGAQDNDFHYFLGCAYEGLGDKNKAEHYWSLAGEGLSEPSAAMYYNDQKPEKIFYQALSWLKLKNVDKANSRFYKLINYGKNHLFDDIKIDYFAVSLPDLLIWDDNLNLRNEIHCNFLLAMGYWGINDLQKSRKYLDEAYKLDVNHQGIMALKSFLEIK